MMNLHVELEVSGPVFGIFYHIPVRVEDPGTVVLPVVFAAVALGGNGNFDVRRVSIKVQREFASSFFSVYNESRWI